MAAVAIAQVEKGWLSTETHGLRGAVPRMPPIAVYEGASFYNMYDLAPVGKHKVKCAPTFRARFPGRGMPPST